MSLPASWLQMHLLQVAVGLNPCSLKAFVLFSRPNFRPDAAKVGSRQGFATGPQKRTCVEVAGPAHTIQAPGKSLSVTWMLRRSLTPRLNYRHGDSIQPSVFPERILASVLRMCHRIRSQRRRRVLCDLGTVGGPRRFTTVRLAETFQRFAPVGMH